MKTALFIVILTFTASALARPQNFDDEYTDNSLDDLLPSDEDMENDRTDYVQM